jgi:hypothetical protein
LHGASKSLAREMASRGITVNVVQRRHGMSGANVTLPTMQAVADFIAALPEPAQRDDAATLVAMMRTATGCDPVMWGASIIGFDRYHYRYDSGREGEMAVVGFSPRKGTLVLYLAPGFEDAAPALSRLGRHRLGKACLYIRRLADVDLEVLQALVAQSVADMRQRHPR